MLKAMKTSFQVMHLILYAGTQSGFQTLNPTAVLLMHYREPVYLYLHEINYIIQNSLHICCLVTTYSFYQSKQKYSL